MYIVYMYTIYTIHIYNDNNNNYQIKCSSNKLE